MRDKNRNNNLSNHTPKVKRHLRTDDSSTTDEPPRKFNPDRVLNFLCTLKDSRNKLGNVWGKWDDLTVSIFVNPRRQWQWSIADQIGVTYSRARFPDMESAAEALLDVLEGRDA